MAAGRTERESYPDIPRRVLHLFADSPGWIWPGSNGRTPAPHVWRAVEAGARDVKESQDDRSINFEIGGV